MSDAKWIRVSKDDRCKVCEHGDWCTYSPELNLVHCLRVPSPRASKNSMGGWLHPLNGEVKRTLPPRPVRKAVPTIDASRLMAEFASQTKPSDICRLSDALGVDSGALEALGCAWSKDYNAWAFPMRNGSKEVVGIRLRSASGHKWAVPGSKGGIFWPIYPHQDEVIVCEGVSDCAAALSLGLFALGRPSCSSGVAETLAALSRLKARRVVIVADNDNKRRPVTGEPYSPGIEGALALQRELTIPSCILIPPAKDLRSYCNLGATRELLTNDISKLIWRNK